MNALFRLLAALALLFAPLSPTAANAAPSTLAPGAGGALRLLDELPAVPRAYREAVLAGDWQEAVRRADALHAEHPEQADSWLFLRALALAGGGLETEALSALDELELRHPKSVWTHKSRFRRAELLRSLGKLDEAERIWEAEAERLRSADRKGELADVYLRFADELSTEPTEPRPGHELDFERAHLLYAKVLELGAPHAKQERAMYRLGFCRVQQERWADAIADDRAYLARFDPTRPDSRAAREGAGEHVFEVRLRLGRSLLASGDRLGARRAFEDLDAAIETALAGEGGWAAVLREAGGEWPAERRQAWERLLGDTAFELGRTYAERSAETALGVAAFQRFLERFPTHPRTSRAAFEIGRLWADLGRHEEALAAWSAFLARPAPASDDEDVRRENEELRQKALFLSASVEAARRRYSEAAELYARYAASYPSGPDWAAAQRGIVDCAYLRGAHLAEEGDFEAARAAWRAFAAEHPLDPRTQQIAFDIGELFRQEANELAAQAREDGAELPERARKLYEDAIAQWELVASKYAGQEVASHALYSIGLVLETRLDRLEDAIHAWRRCNFGGWAAQAAQRLADMTEQSLAVSTERIWREDEPARVTVQTRNIEKLEVRIYALDLEAYFRKHLTHRRIEDLDLDLIAPDRVLEVPVDGYRPYAPLERAVDLPLEGPGVWAVAVTAEGRRATTLVVRSDIDIIIKSSRREAFVFAEDMRQKRPAAGVQVLLAVAGHGPSPEFVELETGTDGVARHTFEGLTGDPDIRVLAHRDGHFAGEGLSLGGLVLARGLTPRGFVYADRPVYRPGQRVRWRAILREVRDGAFTFEEGRAVRVEFLDSAGRAFLVRSLPLSRFGTLSGELDLDPLAPVGTYQIRCAWADGPTFTGTFRVEEYRPRLVDLELFPEREVYYRGEKVTVEARAAFYYGEPLVDSPLAVTLPDGRTESLRTDAEGRARFEYDTRDFVGEGQLVFQANLPEESVAAQAAVWVAAQGFQIGVQAARDIVLAGEPLAVDITTRDPGGQPVARALHLAVLRRVSDRRGQWSEVLSLEREVETGEDGTAQVGVSLERGGSYVLRVSGTDRFGQPVSGEDTVFVSGDDDEVKLRWFADRTRVDVGETLHLDLYDRAGPGLALVTFEGEKVLGYRIVELREGSNPIELAIDHVHFPNLVVSAAMMRGNRFHQASLGLDVVRHLKVTVEPKRERYAPGEEAEVSLTAVDQRGRPVEAELALAVVDAALYDLFPEELPPIASVFAAGTRREAALRTQSSCTFSYEGAVREIDEQVLEEAELARDREAWAERRGRMLDALAAAQEAEGLHEPTAAAGRSLRELGYTVEEDAAGRPGADDLFLGQVVGLGGGAGGKFGARFGGRRRLKSQGGLVADATREPAAPIGETAFWAPAVVTAKDGTATVRFRVPERSTRWRLSCRGVGPGTLVGESEAELVSRAERFLELRAPDLLVEGDRPRIVVRVHDLTGAKGPAQLVLTATADGETQTYPARIELGGDRPLEHTFPALEPMPAGGSLVLEARLSLEGEPTAALATREVPVRPWGLVLSDSASGRLTGEATVELELPGGKSYRGRELSVALTPSIEQLLVDEALGAYPGLPRPLGSIVDDTAGTAGDLLGAAAALDLLTRTGRGGAEDLELLRTRAQALVAALVARQNSDGGWGWIGRGDDSRVEDTARVLWALAAAREAGIAVPPETLESGLARLDRQARSLAQSENERRAAALFALALFGRADFGVANRLHRERGALSPGALSFTALALAAMGREPMAREAAEVLAAQRLPAGDGPGCPWPLERNIAPHRTAVETVALAVLALEQALPASPRVDEGVEWLLTHRPWFPRRARGLALRALAIHRGTTAPARERLEVVVAVEGAGRQTLRLDAGGPSRKLTFAIPDDAGRRVRVSLRSRGRGTPHYALVLSGFTPDVEPRETAEFAIREQRYQAPRPVLFGKPIPVGFDVLRRESGEAWVNEVEHLEFGARTDVVLRFEQQRERSQPLEELDDLVLSVPLPAGARVLEGSVRGAFRAYHLRDGLLTFDLGRQGRSGYVNYTLVGAFPGEYRALPAVLASALHPDHAAIFEPGELTVLSRGGESPDEYRPTPDELYHLGTRLADAGELERAYPLLRELFDTYERVLKEKPLEEVAARLFGIVVEHGEAAEIVRYFEVLRERAPERTIPFERIVRVGRAYRELGEFERALLIFRATIEETYGMDLKVAGTLEEQGEFAAATETIGRLWLEYPDLPVVVESYLTLADELLAKAPQAARDESLRRAGKDRAALMLEAVLTLERFLSLYPSDPLAPEAGLDLVSAWLSFEDYRRAADLAEQFAALFEKPDFRDAFRYTEAVADWYLGRDDQAMEILTSISEARYTDETGNTRPSTNRELALYILAQIHHARLEIEQAAQFYERVRDAFADAREALADLRRREVALPEVTTTVPGEPAKLVITSKNIEDAELLVYSVDLMTLYLREKNLSNITSVNLAGITPTLRRTVALGKRPEARPAEHEVSLDLAEPGAYLVICRGGELHASGLVLVSDIELLVSEEPASGHMRIQAVGRDEGRFLSNVDVRVIGSRDGKLRRGRTDRRGLFVADGVSGYPTVIAQAGADRYAFYRGETPLGEVAGGPATPGRAAGGRPPLEEKAKQLDKSEYFKNVFELNKANVEARRQRFEGEVQRARKGVQIKQVR